MKLVVATILMVFALGVIAPEPANHEWICDVKPLHHDEIHHALKLFNDARDKIASGKHGHLPQASDMKELRWDPIIAGMAAEWAKTCPHGNSAPNRHESHNKSTEVREVIFVASSNCHAYTTPQWEKALLHWTKEGDHVDNKLIGNYSWAHNRSDETRAFTQISWGQTAFVGCAYANYQKTTGASYSQMIVCHFLNGGNHIGQPVYSVGTPCSKCDKGFACSKNYTHLCLHDETHEHHHKHDTTPVVVKNCSDKAFTTQERTAFLDKINKERSAVATGHYAGYKSHNLTGYPASSNMEQLLWDDGLEKTSQIPAGNCKPSASNQTAYHVSEIFFGMGSTKPFDKPHWDTAVEYWLMAKANVTDSLLKKFANGTWHEREAKTYTQLIWANSGHVGCAYGNHAEIWHSKFNFTTPAYRQIIICHFTNTGNKVGEPVYKVGKECTECPSGFSCSKEYVGLCKKN